MKDETDCHGLVTDGRDGNEDRMSVGTLHLTFYFGGVLPAPFSDVTAEAEFKYRQSIQIQRNLRRLSCVVALTSVVALSISLANGPDLSQDGERFRFIAFCAAPAFNLLIALIAPRVSFHFAEFVAMATVCVTASLFLVGSWHWSSSAAEATDGVLPTLALTLAMGFALPVRCIWRWPLLVIPIAYVVHSAILGTSLAAAPVLFGQALIVFFGGASAEATHRALFAAVWISHNPAAQEVEKQEENLVVEKQIEMPAEVDTIPEVNIVQQQEQEQLQQQQEQEQARQPSRPSKSSVASSVIFDAPVKAPGLDEFRKQLEAIAAVGQTEHWLIPPNKVSLYPEIILGCGGFGVVVVGRLYGLQVAVKMPLAMTDCSHAISLVNEIRVLRRLRHPNLVSFIGACIDQSAGDVSLIQELIPGPSLAQMITKPPSNPCSEDRRRILLGICKSIKYLHAQDPPVLHGDLKPANVLFRQGTMIPKLTDFGNARILKPHTKARGGTPRWSPPEVFSMRKRAKPSTHTDIFGFGRLSYFTITGTQPLEHLDLNYIRDMLKKDMLPDEQWPEKAVPFQSECQHLCRQCFDLNPLNRPTLVELHDQIWEWPHWLEPPGSDKRNTVQSWLLDDNVLPPSSAPVEHLPWLEAAANLRQAREEHGKIGEHMVWVHSQENGAGNQEGTHARDPVAKAQAGSNGPGEDATELIIETGHTLDLMEFGTGGTSRATPVVVMM